MKTTLSETTLRHYGAAHQKGSTGALNAEFECAVTQALRLDGRYTQYIRGAGQTDWYGIEVKSCCSETGSEAEPLEEILKAEFILYTPDLPDREVIETDSVACLETCWIFTPAQFIEMLCYIHKGGAEPHIKLNKDRGRYNIQTLRQYNKKTGKWSELPYKKMWQFVRENGIQNASVDWWLAIRPTLKAFR